MKMEGAIYQLVLCTGEWDWYHEDVIFADADLDAVREARDELKRRATAALAAGLREGMAYGQDIYGKVAEGLEDGCTVRVERLPMGVLAYTLPVVVDRDEWYMPMYNNMTTEPHEELDPNTNLYEDMAIPFEEKFKE